MTPLKPGDDVTILDPRVSVGDYVRWGSRQLCHCRYVVVEKSDTGYRIRNVKPCRMCNEELGYTLYAPNDDKLPYIWDPSPLKEALKRVEP